MGERNKVRGYRQGATYFRFKRSRVVLDELIILTRKVSYLTWNVICIWIIFQLDKNLF